MTKPNTVPSTVNSWFEIPKLAEVNPSTVETTTEQYQRGVREGVDTLTRRNEAEEENFRPDVIDDSGLQFLPRKGTLEQRIVGYHDART